MRLRDALGSIRQSAKSAPPLVTRRNAPLRLDHQVGTIDNDLLAAQQQVQRLDQLMPVQAVARRQHPDELDDGHQRDEAGLLASEALDQACGLRSLLRVVLHGVAHQDVGIEPDHRDREACAAMAVFISPISTNSIRSPASTLSARRTSTRIVLWPLLVNVAAAMYLLLLPCFGVRDLTCQVCPRRGSAAVITGRSPRRSPPADRPEERAQRLRGWLLQRPRPADDRPAVKLWPGPGLWAGPARPVVNSARPVPSLRGCAAQRARGYICLHRGRCRQRRWRRGGRLSTGCPGRHL